MQLQFSVSSVLTLECASQVAVLKGRNVYRTPSLKKNLFAPTERDIPFVSITHCALKARRQCLLRISYKHLAALRPGTILSANVRDRTLAVPLMNRYQSIICVGGRHWLLVVEHAVVAEEHTLLRLLSISSLSAKDASGRTCNANTRSTCCYLLCWHGRKILSCAVIGQELPIHDLRWWSTLVALRRALSRRRRTHIADVAIQLILIGEGRLRKDLQC